MVKLLKYIKEFKMIDFPLGPELIKGIEELNGLQERAMFRKTNAVKMKNEELNLCIIYNEGVINWFCFY